MISRTRVRTTGADVKDFGRYRNDDGKPPMGKKEVMEQIRNNEGCRIHGILDTWKLMGTLTITTEGGFVLAQIANEDLDLYNKVHLRHYFNELSFGPKHDMKKI